MDIPRKIMITAATVVLTVGMAASPSLAKKAPAAPVSNHHHAVTHKVPPTQVVPALGPVSRKQPPSPPPVTPSGERARVVAHLRG